ncbi:hypothetical protein Pelo_4924 [Pelomyxa schiedti]|nr:hypothetical protein Pelo_4924 [Pelomyxa schiedti]
MPSLTSASSGVMWYSLSTAPTAPTAPRCTPLAPPPPYASPPTHICSSMDGDGGGAGEEEEEKEKKEAPPLTPRPSAADAVGGGATHAPALCHPPSCRVSGNTGLGGKQLFVVLWSQRTTSQSTIRCFEHFVDVHVHAAVDAGYKPIVVCNFSPVFGCNEASSPLLLRIFKKLHSIGMQAEDLFLLENYTSEAHRVRTKDMQYHQ